VYPSKWTVLSIHEARPFLTNGATPVASRGISAQSATVCCSSMTGGRSSDAPEAATCWFPYLQQKPRDLAEFFCHDSGRSQNPMYSSVVKDKTSCRLRENAHGAGRAAPGLGMMGWEMFPHGTRWPATSTCTLGCCQKACRLVRQILIRDPPAFPVNKLNLNFHQIRMRQMWARQFQTNVNSTPLQSHVPLVVVDVLHAMRRPTDDPNDPDPFPSSLRAMNSEPLPTTRFPRSPLPPSIPPRNPLRQKASSVRNVDNDRPFSPPTSPARMQIVHTQSLPLLGPVKTIAVNSNEAVNVDEKQLGKSLSESPIMVPLSPVDIDDGDSSTGSSSILTNSMSPPPTVSKRNHALLELLSSERAYASDLALIRDIHIPLALGE